MFEKLHIAYMTLVPHLLAALTVAVTAPSNVTVSFTYVAKTVTGRKTTTKLVMTQPKSVTIEISN